MSARGLDKHVLLTKSLMRSQLESLRSVCGIAEGLTYRLRTPGDESPNDVYVGHVMLPGWDLRERAYVKIFPPALRGQLVYNEVLAHYMAVQCALPSPLTFPCAVRRTFLRSATQLTMVPDARSQFVMGVASLDVASGSVKQTMVASDAKKLDVLNWANVARVAVFDELMANDDRRIENLVRRELHDYEIIDHDRIMFGLPWSNLDLSALEGRPCDPNILADTIAEATDEAGRQRMMHVAQHLILVTALCPPSVCEDIEKLCGLPAGSTRRLVEMLNRRRVRIRSLLQWHLRKGDLFQARTNR